MIYNSSKLPSLRFQNKSCPYSRLRFGSIYPPGYRKTRLPSHAHIWFFSKIGSLAQEHYRASQFRITHSIRSLNLNSPIFIPFIQILTSIYVFLSAISLRRTSKDLKFFFLPSFLPCALRQNFPKILTKTSIPC